MNMVRRRRLGHASVTALVAVLMVSSVAMAGRTAVISDQRSPIQDAPTPVPIGEIGITSWTSWVDGGRLYVVGDLFNNTDARYDIEVRAALYNSSDVLLDTWTFSAGAWLVAAGTHAPFAYDDVAPAGFDHAVVSLNVYGFDQTIRGPLLITPGTPHTDGDGRHYPATMKNLSSLYLRFFDVRIGLYDASGNVINAHGVGYSKEFNQPIAPGETFAYDIVIPDHFAGATRVLMQAYAPDYVDLHNIMVSWNDYFDDIYNSQFRADIIWNAEQGITGGCADLLFCPTANVTRGQMAAFLDRALHLPATATDFFTDDEESIYEVDINRLAAAAITSGCTATTFCPSASVTRGQMAAFLARAFHLPTTTSDFFSDDETSIFESDINRLAAAGITGGCTATTFCPTALVTRGQMTAFLHRALD